jgi:uncharacterized RDD family membrane protein YckC
MSTPPIDTRHRQETPEGVELTLSPAGPVPRGLAWAIDLAMRGVLYSAGAGALSLLGEAGMGLMLIGVFVLEWGYPVYFELQSGSTPGKSMLSLRVVHEDGSPLTLGSALLRNLVRFVDFLPVGYLFGVWSCLLTGRFQRLGDLAAGTLVVHHRHLAAKPLPQTVAPRPPLVPLSLEEQRAIVAFAERADQWSPERLEELASHSGACTHGSKRERVQQLLSYARWIAGER